MQFAGLEVELNLYVKRQWIELAAVREDVRAAWGGGAVVVSVGNEQMMKYGKGRRDWRSGTGDAPHIPDPTVHAILEQMDFRENHLIIQVLEFDGEDVGEREGGFILLGF